MGSRSSARRHAQIDGNSRDGALFAESASRYLGTRRTTKGKFEERVFEGREYKVKEEWRKWRDETLRRESIHVESVRVQRGEDHVEVPAEAPAEATRGESDMPARKKTDGETVYVLVCRHGKAQKDIAVFRDMDLALRMAESLGIASEVSGGDGEFDVTELEVWG